MNDNPISLDKKYRTQDGREARIYALDGIGSFCVHGAIKTDAGWLDHKWTGYGCAVADRPDFPNNLVEVRQHHKRVVWMNVYASCSSAFTSKELANSFVGHNRIACLRVEFDFEEGQFDEEERMEARR